MTAPITPGALSAAKRLAEFPLAENVAAIHAQADALRNKFNAQQRYFQEGKRA